MSEGAKLDLKAGEWIEVKAAAEILATLDENGTLDSMPFMTEMLAHCGRRYQVYKRADKTCDTVLWTGIRHMERTVHLDMLRCDGSAHDGCQAGCLMFWKEAWLRRVDGPAPVLAEPADATSGDGHCRKVLAAAGIRSRLPDGSPCYRCQATELNRASSPSRWWTPGQYVRDLCLNNASFAEVGRSIAIAAYRKVLHSLTGRHYPDVRGTLKRTPIETLGLQAGDWVIVKSREEILATLDTTGRNRGMTFDTEMLPYCGNRYRVLRRVTRIIEETTGRIIEPAGVSVILENVVCKAVFRRSCPRSIYPYWREIWLRRATADETPPVMSDDGSASAAVGASVNGNLAGQLASPSQTG